MKLHLGTWLKKSGSLADASKQWGASAKLPISNLGRAKLVGGQGSGGEQDPVLTSVEPTGESKHSLLCLSNTELLFHICMTSALY